MTDAPANDNRAAAAPTLIYFADPMCSWCWGFAPILEEVMGPGGAGTGLPLTIVVGGLRAYNTTAMDAEQKGYISRHWRNVAERSGQPFDLSFFERDGFVYDTEPACRAVVTVREQDPEHAPHMLKAIQAAFYRDNRDVTTAETLTAIAGEIGLDAEGFAARFASDAIKAATSHDFDVSRQAGVKGFPTLIAGTPDQGFGLVTAGYTDAVTVSERIKAVREAA